ncbi:MAG: PAS domain S-box protein [Gemmatales bacterium]
MKESLPSNRSRNGWAAPWWVSYGVAIIALGAATFVRWVLDPVLGNNFPFPPYFVAAALIAGFGRTRSATLTLVCGGLLGVYLFVPPRYSFPLNEPSVLLSLVLYLIVGSVVIAMSHAMRSAQKRAERSLFEAQRAQRAEAEGRERLQTTLSSIGDAVITTDAEGYVTNLNPVAETLTGWANKDAEGKSLVTVFNIVNETTRQPVENPALRALNQGRVVGLANHTVLISKDGIEWPIDDSAAPIRGSNGEVGGAVLVFRDITDRKRLEQEAAARLNAARLLAAIIESSNDAIISKSLDGIIQSWNVAAERLFGYTAAEAVGRSVMMLIPVDRADEETQIISQIRAGKRVDHFDTVRLRKDGQLIHVALTISPVRDEVGQVVGASQIARDVTDRITAERALREGERELQLAVAAAKLGRWTLNLATREMICSDVCKANYGWRPGDPFTYDDLWATVHPDDRERVETAFRRAVETHNDYEAEYRVLWLDGSVHWVLVRGQTENAPEGTPLTMTGVSLDITDRRQAEEKLRGSEERYRTLVEQVKEHAIFGTDIQGRATTWNEGVRKVLGFEESEFIGKDIVNTIFTPEDMESGAARRELEKAAASGSASDDRWMRRKDGTRFWAAGITTARRDEAGTLVGFTKVMRDMTEWKRMQDELHASESRLAAEAGALARLNEASSRLWQMPSLHEGLEEMLSATIDLLGAHMGNIQLLEEGVLKIAVHRGFKPDFLDFFSEVTTEDDSACGRTLRAGLRTIIEDIETDGPYEPLRPIARSAGYRAVQSTPLIDRNGTPLGMVSTHFRTPHRPDAQELRRLDLYVRQAADFIGRSRAEQELLLLAANLSEAARQKDEFLALLCMNSAIH